MGLVGGVNIGGSHMEAVENSLYQPNAMLLRSRSDKKTCTTPMKTLRSMRP